jgi:uncharacterized protein (DUF1330 family)
MPAYVIADVTVHDPDGYAEYAKENNATVPEHGGRFIVRGGPVEVAEGDWDPGRVVVIEFPSMEDLKAWWNSDRYQAAAEIRRANSTGKILFVEGYEP